MKISDNILIVDDDRNIITILQEILTEDGFNVITAANGQEAFILFEQHKPIIAIIDALLPKMNGFELAAKIRATEYGNRIPLIMISGIYKSLRMSDQLRNLDINEFIEKPFDLGQLLTKVKQLLQVNLNKVPEVEFFNHQGKLNAVSIPRLLYLFYRNLDNGTLYLVKDKLKKKITIKSGEPYFVESNLVQECLGRLLIKKGRLTQEQCDESLSIMKSKKTKQGETLITMGLITPNDLDEALREQAREKLFDVFSWDDGDYRFIPGEKFPDGLTRIDLTLPQLLIRGVRNGFAMERLKREMDDFLDKAIHLKENPKLKFEDFRLATWDERILHEINGEQKLRQIVQSKAARDIDIYQLLYVFLKTDMIEFTETESEKNDKATINRMRRILEEIKQQNYYSILGINQKIDEKQLFSSFSQKMSQYHPTTSSLNPSKSTKIGTLLQEICDYLQKAYNTLSNTDSRIAYDREQFLTKGVIPHDAAKVFDADNEFKRIKSELARGYFDKVENVSQAMISVFPKDWRFAAYHGWSRFKLLCKQGEPTESLIKECSTEIANAIRLEPRAAEAYFFLGNIFKLQNDVENAKAFFLKAKEFNANHVDAERELRLIEMRDGKKSKSFIKWK